MKNTFQIDQNKHQALLVKLNQRSSKPSKSLAETLRKRRELQEHIEQERSRVNIGRQPKEIDEKGTTFRIRPQTPKINLLNKKYSNKNQQGNKQMQAPGKIGMMGKDD